jgi:hypothetical protein
MYELEFDNPYCKYKTTLLDLWLHWEWSQHQQSDGNDALAPLCSCFIHCTVTYGSSAMDFTFDRDFIFRRNGFTHILQQLE